MWNIFFQDILFFLELFFSFTQVWKQNIYIDFGQNWSSVLLMSSLTEK